MTAESEANSEEILAKLDFTRIHFPSDRLTVLALRQRHPDLFDHGFKPGSWQPKYFLQFHPTNPAEDGIGDLLFLERLVAACAFAAAKNLPVPDDWNYEDSKEQLVTAICAHGLANGEHEAREQVREISRQVIQLSHLIGR